MEFIEVLVLIDLVLMIYCVVKLNIVETKIANAKTPEEIAKEILGTKIPVIMGPNGPIPMDESFTKPKHNPITG